MQTQEYWFFLSYARTDEIGLCVKKFHKDLSEEIRALASLPASTKVERIGFLDEQAIEVGDRWTDSIAGGLQTARGMVCLYSRAYFESEYCGKEFEVFRLRSQQATASTPRIMPVLWRSPKEIPYPLPEIASHLQYTAADFGHAYAEYGLFRLMRVHKYRDEYYQFLLEFAKRLYANVVKFVAPPLSALPPLSQIKNPFRRTSTALSQNEILARSKGPSTIHFYFIAGRQADLQSVKNEVSAYGENGGHDWRPFLPKVDYSAGLMSQRAASRVSLISQMCLIDEEFIKRLMEAEKENTIVVLVVDPWTTRINFYRDCLRQYDSKRFVNCAVLVIWNDRDPETRKNLAGLKQAIDLALARHRASEDPCFQDSIKSADTFRIAIEATVFEIRRRLMKLATILRQPLPGTGTKPPRISGIAGGPHDRS